MVAHIIRQEGTQGEVLEGTMEGKRGRPKTTISRSEWEKGVRRPDYNDTADMSGDR